MPLYRVVFEEQGGYRVACRMRAAMDANHLALAVQKIWGASCYWVWVPGSDTEGRVYERRGDPEAPEDRARTVRPRWRSPPHSGVHASPKVYFGGHRF